MVKSLGLLITQIINLPITIIFLALFIYRFINLRSYSMTNRYRNYIPKLRITFALIFIVLSIADLVYNIVTGDQPQYYDYILQGGGECINSVILVIQFGVLRMELLKQQPYTPFHLLYFIYLALITLVRFGFTIQFIILGDQDIFTIVVSALFVLDCVIQLAYWLAKKQSLPQFQLPTPSQIYDLSIPIFTNRTNQRTYWKNNSQNFPYIVPSVNIEQGMIRIILQSVKNSQLYRQQQDSSPKKDTDKLAIKRSTAADSQILQIVSSQSYSLEDLKEIYIVCGRLPIKRQLDFQNQDLPSFAKSCQLFLEQLFAQKKWYQTQILKCFHVRINKLAEYANLIEMNSIKIQQGQQVDQVQSSLGQRDYQDKNAIFCSIAIYRHLWVCDHYQFYIKAQLAASKITSFPIKRFSQFQALVSWFKNTKSARNIQLPSLPNKHLFLWNQGQQILKRRTALQTFLKYLCNDYLIMQSPVLRNKVLQFLDIQDQKDIQAVQDPRHYQNCIVAKGEINKGIIRDNDYVTFYQFRLVRQQQVLTKVYKRFRDFQHLHKQLERWWRNSQANGIPISQKLPILPQKHLYRSQVIRHQKLKSYLQQIIQTKSIQKLYAVNWFFNIHGVSQYASQHSSGQKYLHTVSRQSKNVQLSIFELEETMKKSISQRSSKRFSQIMNDLGNEALD